MAGGHAGSCLCGAVSFRVAGALSPVTYCHCSQCRKQTSAFYASTDAAFADVTFDSQDGLVWYAASDMAKRGFCSSCGSMLFWRRTGSGRIAISAGALAMPTGLKAERHIFVDDKADFLQLADGLPQFPQSHH